MKPPDKRQRIPRVLLALFLLGLGLLAGTSTGRVQVYRGLFNSGPDKLQIWAAKQMGTEPPETALPVIFALLEDPELDRSWDFDGHVGGLWPPPDLLMEPEEGYLDRGALLFRAVLEVGQSKPSTPSSVMDGPGKRRQRLLENGFGLLCRPEALEALIDSGLSSPRPSLRIFSVSILGWISGNDDPPAPILDRIHRALRLLARRDPDPQVRRHALVALAWRERDLDLYLSLFATEKDLLVRGQILESIHESIVPDRRSRPNPEGFDRILRALTAFWRERLESAALEARASPPGELRLFTNFHAYRKSGRLRVLRWLRDHPEDVALLDQAFIPLPALSPELREATFAFLQESRSPKVVGRIAYYLTSVPIRADPSPLLPLARDRLRSELEAEKAIGVELLAVIANNKSGLGPENRIAAGELLEEALADPELRRPFRHHLDLLGELSAAEALLAEIATDPDPELRAFARFALIRRGKKAGALTAEELIAALLPEGFKTPILLTFTETQRDRSEWMPPPGQLVTQAAAAPNPDRALRVLEELGETALPALLPALRTCAPKDLDRLLTKIQEIFPWGDEALQRLAREPGVLGEKASALIGDERAVDQR